MVQFQCCSEIVKPELVLQEYIPVRIEWERKKEIVKCLEFTDGNKSLLEIVIGEESKRIHRITMPICNNYVFSKPIKALNVNRLRNMELETMIDDTRKVIECDLTIFMYDRQIDIILSKEPLEIYKYVDNGRVRFGLDEKSCLKEISIRDISEKEKAHIKQELEFQ